MKGDTIYRQEAIDALDRIGSLDTDADRKYAREVIKALPAAQTEIIRCRDCVKNEICRTSSVWAVAPNDDWFCADAERRTDG